MEHSATNKPRVQVELFGIARERFGAASTIALGNCLGDVLNDLASQQPAFADHCMVTNDDSLRLNAWFIANLNGNDFITDPKTPIPDESTLLILSADAGG